MRVLKLARPNDQAKFIVNYRHQRVDFSSSSNNLEASRARRCPAILIYENEKKKNIIVVPHQTPIKNTSTNKLLGKPT